MNQHLSPDDIKALTVEERLRLIEQLWAPLDEIDVLSRPLTPEQRDELDRRLAAHAADGGRGREWAEVRSSITVGFSELVLHQRRDRAVLDERR